MNTHYSRPFDDTSGDKYSRRGSCVNFELGEEEIPIFLIYKTGNKMNDFTFDQGRTTYDYFDSLGKGTGYPINMFYDEKFVSSIFFRNFKERQKIIQKYYNKRVNFYYNGLQSD